jgi:undecaprenyl-diphosphatase
VPDTSPVTTGAGSHRAVVVALVVTFAVVLVVGVVIGLALRPLLLPTGATAFDRHVTDWVFAHWRTGHGLSVTNRVSWLGGPILAVPIAVATTLALALLRRWRLVACFVVTVAGAALLNVLVRAIVDPRRPPGELGLRHPFASSFPSGHATQAAATYVGIALVVMALTRAPAARVLVWTLAAALILAVGVARVYLAVHWTTDVLTGVVIGTLWALGTAHAFRPRAAAAAAAAADGTVAPTTDRTDGRSA